MLRRFDLRRSRPADWLLAAILLGGTALMYVYPPSMWWDVVAQALATGFYIGRRSATWNV